MKANFKQLGLAAAVAAATAGVAATSQAQSLSSNGLGDLAIVPYYTVQGDFVTGIHIINTSIDTQIVKLRFRRGSDSMDALDFNLIMSGKDEWTGFIDDSSGNIVVQTEDTTCTAPLRPNGDFPMPALYAAGAEEGYVEVIGMATVAAASYAPGVPASGTSPAVPPTNPIHGSADHGTVGVPADCIGAESNFFRVSTVTPTAASGDVVVGGPNNGVNAATLNGVLNSALTHQSVGTAKIPNVYTDMKSVLKVSYFIRDAASGLEFGSDAVHIEDFQNAPMMTNQEIIIANVPDLYSFLFPDLDGGSPLDTPRGLYNSVIRPVSGLGAASVINDWSVAAARNVSTDWVVTMPGQYLMLDLGAYTLGGATGAGCLSQAAIDAQVQPSVPADVACDQRDIPVVLNASNGVWDREEQTFTSPEGGLVISPEVGIGPAATTLPNEVNVIEWTNGENLPVLDSQYASQFDVSALGADFGWANLSVSSDPTKGTDSLNYGHAVYNFLNDPNTAGDEFTRVTNLRVPVAGFVAWERSFPSDPSANYGRIVDHSYGS